MKLTCLIFTAILQLYAVALAESDVLFDTLLGEGNSATGFGGSRMLAQKFQSGSEAVAISSIELQLTRTGSAGSPTLEIWSDSSGLLDKKLYSLNPNGDIQETGIYSFTTTEEAILSPSSQYWAVVRGSEPDGQIEQFRWWYLSQNTVGLGDGFLPDNRIIVASETTTYFGWPYMMKIHTESLSSNGSAIAVAIEPAVHLSFQAELGKVYRIERSLDLENWITVRDGIQGDGNVSNFEAISNAEKYYWRVVEVDPN
jgi:hypothetical protein